MDIGRWGMCTLRECPFPRATKDHGVAEDGEELEIALCTRQKFRRLQLHVPLLTLNS